MSNISPPVRKRAISGTSTGCTHRIDRDRLVSPANIVNGIRLKTSSFSADSIVSGFSLILDRRADESANAWCAIVDDVIF
ncbi:MULTISPECIES: hypothetical protein [Rhodococcus]|uniref:hypothetical protein n=1 Tax=Rhodococcus TaxID=1827 RepID=UPI001FC9D14F|nr:MULTISPECIES: hypothetical protein [Rhodococcus]